MQKLQMDTQEGKNVCVYAIKGNFDDAQSGVKRIFTDLEISNKLNIPVVLYIKPVLYNITLKDVDKYVEIIKKYGIKNVVVGSIIKTNGSAIC